MTPKKPRLTIKGAFVAFFGVCSVLLGFVCILLYFGPRPVSGLRCWLFGGFFIVVGIGTVRQYRWYALILAGSLVAFAMTIAIDSIGNVPYPYILVNFFGAAMLCLPAVATYCSWNQLR